MRYIDAHNHLQDGRLTQYLPDILGCSQQVGITFSAINGTSPLDWPIIESLSKQNKWLVPNFGVHPWHINNLTAEWESLLNDFLDRVPSGIGETGIDGWRKEFDPGCQEEIFRRQLQIAARRDLPISIHGLRRWGRLLEILKESPRPACGFMLHSYGGPAEMIPAFVKLGGYFSCPGFFLSPGREMKLSVFLKVPRDRLLIETDSPDQNLPESIDLYRLASPIDGARINHPGNIVAIYRELAKFLGCSIEELCRVVEENFSRLFKPVLEARARDISTHSR
jgi:TatD DNase family protein